MNNALNDFIFYSKYARYNHKLNRKETFAESVDRVFEMHSTHIMNNYPQMLDNVEFSKKFLETWEACKSGIIYGSQRALQFGGDKILTKNARLYNCAYSYCNRPEFFGELFWILLCGCGAGVSVHTTHVDMLPVIKHTNEVQKLVSIEDSIEGWADSVTQLVNSYMDENLSNIEILFDYSKIRPNGSFISGGFLAPGPEGLKKAIEKIRVILNNAIGKKLKPVECYSIICHIADSVLSGGVRRSAVSILFDSNDNEMRLAKTGNWFVTNPHYGRSNNSIMIIRDEENKDTFEENFKATKQYGEPGFAFLKNIWVGFNPCFEIGMEPRLLKKDGSYDYGWLFCNLTTLSGKDIKSEEDFYKYCDLLSFLGTIQATYNKFSYLGDVTEKLVLRDSLLGCSLSGIMSNTDIILNPDILAKGAEIIKNTNEYFAKLLNINPAARTTCIKPDGNFSSMTGNSPGCHPAHSKRYIRRVQVNKEEEAGIIYKNINPSAVTESVWSNNNTDNVISFAIEHKDGTLFKKNLNAIEHLDIVKLLQKNWVDVGNRNIDSGVSHNVSVTVLIDDNEWDSVKNYIWDNQKYFSGISLLPKSGDLIYNQAAYSEVLLPEEMLKLYGDGILFASGLIVDIEDVFEDLWKACDVINGKGEKIYTSSKDVYDYLIKNNIILPTNYYNLPYNEVIQLQDNCKVQLRQLLLELKYPVKMVDYLIGFNDLTIFEDEIKKYLDNELFEKVSNLSAKRDIIRRIYKFSKKYFNDNISLTLDALKHVQLFHDWCAIKKNHINIDWSTIKWNKIENINVNTLAASNCSGGACEITKI